MRNYEIYKNMIFFKNKKILYNKNTGKWYKARFDKKTGYFKFWIGTRILNYHRILGELYLSRDGLGEEYKVIDHINRQRTDNRLSNLRWVTYKQNSENRRNFNFKFGYWYEG
jgi:hypothetical protein